MQNSASQTEEKVKGISIRVVLVLAIFVAILLLLLFITDEFVLEGETGFDTKVFDFLSAYTSPGTTRIMNVFTFFGSTRFLLPAYAALILFYVFYKKNNRLSFNIAAVGLGSITLLMFIKNIFRRHRPPHPLIQDVQGFSYPSGHSTSAFTLSGILMYILWSSHVHTAWKWIGTILLFVFAAIVALSRVYLHVHYASDVVAGFCLAFLWLTISLYMLYTFNRGSGLPKAG